MPADLLTRDEARDRAALISNVDYRIELELSDDPARATYSSVTTMTFDAATAGASTFLNLNAAGAEVWLNGVKQPAGVFSGDRIQLDGLAAHNEVKVIAAARYEKTGVGMHRLVDPADGQVYLYTHFEPFDAHRVFACFDQPDLKAKYNLSVTAPDHWSVISNGAETTSATASTGSTRHDFKQTESMSTYLAAVVAGPYHRITDTHKGVEMNLWCRTSMAPYMDKDKAEIFEITRQGLDHYGDYFQIPYPFGKYDQLFVPEFNMGAMEQPGCVTFNESYLFRSRVTQRSRARRAEVILHEMAHMWFGDLVTMKWWDDLWLNESFATLMSAMAQHDSTKFKDSWLYFADRVKSWALDQDQLPTTHPIVADCPDTATARQNFDGITYAKGASSLRQLHALIGDEPFRDGLRAYMKKYAWGNATLADFLSEVGAGSGRNLDQWAKEWLQTTGPNTLTPDATLSNGTIVKFAVDQTADPKHPTLRTHRLAVGLYSFGADGKLSRTEQIEVDVTGPRTELPQLAGKRADLILLNDGDLTYAKVRLDPRSLQTAIASVSDIDDPLTRRLIWSGAWDMVRDAEIAATQYVDMVARHVTAEKDPDTVAALLADAASCASYGHPQHRDAVRGRVAALAKSGMDAADAGSDLQLVYAQSYISNADAPADLARFARLLDGQETISGLDLDVSMRWNLLMRLAVKGRATEQRIAQELAHDNTDFGKRNAEMARTASPTQRAKQSAWQQLTSDPDMKLATMRSVIGGFYAAGQEQLTDPYAALYEQSVAQWWAQREPDVASALTSGLFPPYRGNAKAIAVADRLLANPTLPAQAKRILAERRDGMLRLQRTHAADLAFHRDLGGRGDIAV